MESVREERNQLAAENEVLVKYISNLVQQYGNVMDTSGNGGISSFQTAATASDNNRQSQPSAFIGRLNRIFSPSSASSNSAKSAIPGHSKNNSSYNIGGPGMFFISYCLISLIINL